LVQHSGFVSGLDAMRAVLLLLIGWVSQVAAQPAAPVVVLTQNGPIGPASTDYLHRGFAKAAALNAQLVILKLDTPGGLDTSMRAIIKDILASPIPVAAFVAPGGARAASAGTYILYASHVAAMAPATNLGAATPVAIGAAPEQREPATPADKTAKDGTKGSEPAAPTMTPMERKQTSDAAAYIRGLAQLRGRNADWAEKAVRDAASLSAEEAVRLNVVDLIAADVPQLLGRLDGRKLLVLGRESRLHTQKADLIDDQPGWRTRLLAAITDPSIAYVLLLLGIYGLLFEFYSPGLVAPGVVGGISLLLALFAFALLTESYTGLALVALGVGLMISEHFVPGFGVLGIGGIVAFVIGSVMLVNPDVLGTSIPWPLVATLSVAGTALIAVVLNLVASARKRPVVGPGEQMIGATGEVLGNAGDTDTGAAYARIRGEMWKVRSGAALERGQRVRVAGIEGLVLAVEPVHKGDAK
jgi:membrane-bound serine protease (ClpP class)